MAAKAAAQQEGGYTARRDCRRRPDAVLEGWSRTAFVCVMAGAPSTLQEYVLCGAGGISKVTLPFAGIEVGARIGNWELVIVTALEVVLVKVIICMPDGNVPPVQVSIALGGSLGP